MTVKLDATEDRKAVHQACTERKDCVGCPYRYLCEKFRYFPFIPRCISKKRITSPRSTY